MMQTAVVEKHEDKNDLPRSQKGDHCGVGGESVAGRCPLSPPPQSGNNESGHQCHHTLLQPGDHM